MPISSLRSFSELMDMTFVELPQRYPLLLIGGFSLLLFFLLAWWGGIDVPAWAFGVCAFFAYVGFMVPVRKAS